MTDPRTDLSPDVADLSPDTAGAALDAADTALDRPFDAADTADAAFEASGPRRGTRIARWVVAVVAVLAVGGTVAWYVNRDRTVSANVGDCLTGERAQDYKVVRCDDPSARHRVLGRVERVTKAQLQAPNSLVCNEYPAADSGYWQAKGDSGYVLCLEPVNK